MTDQVWWQPDLNCRQEVVHKRTFCASFWIEEWCSYNFAAGSFHTKKLYSRLFSREVEFYWHKQRYCVFVPPLEGFRGNGHGSSMVRWKAHGRLHISANWTFFASFHGWGTMSGYWSKWLCSKGGWITLSANFRGIGRLPPTTVVVRKLESLGHHVALFAWSYV